MITKLNHIAIAVADLEAGQYFWHDVLELPLTTTKRVENEGVDVAFLQLGESQLELIQPFEDNGVARYLEKRGAGIHHICLEVDDIVAVLERLDAANLPLINDKPKAHADGTQYAFVHPKGTGGVLVELYQLPEMT